MESGNRNQISGIQITMATESWNHSMIITCSLEKNTLIKPIKSQESKLSKVWGYHTPLSIRPKAIQGGYTVRRPFSVVGKWREVLMKNCEEKTGKKKHQVRTQFREWQWRRLAKNTQAVLKVRTGYSLPSKLKSELTEPSFLPKRNIFYKLPNHSAAISTFLET